MAHNPHHSPEGMTEHKNTYEGFLNGSAALTIICGFIMVALVTFRFMDNPMNLVVGFGGLLVGLIATLLGWRTGGNWLFPSVLLALYGLFVAINI